MKEIKEGTHVGSESIHFSWSRQHPPVIAVDSGSTVHVATRDGFNGQITDPGFAETLEKRFWRDFALETPLSGPIAVKGANPGDVLRVDLVDLKPRGLGACVIWPRWLTWDFLEIDQRDDLPSAHIRVFDLDDSISRGSITFADGIALPIKPVLGMIGTAPAHGEFHSFAAPPRDFGGTFDCTDLRAGNAVFLPVEVKDALLSMGDGHALQGDGEVCTTALECAMDVTLNISLLTGRGYATPRILSPDELMIVAYGRTLDIAVRKAINSTLDVLVEEEGWDRHEAYALCSLEGDVRVNQVVALPHVSVRLAIPREHAPRIVAEMGG